MSRYLTGIKPTGQLHLGNYISAIAPIIDLNGEDETYFFVADYHALTTQINPKLLRQQSIDLLAALYTLLPVHAGKKVQLYRQSQIPEIFELYYIFNCYMNKGFLNRAHAYKTMVDDNLENGRDEDKNVNAGLFTYPTLMAADILMFNPDFIPVGKDQKQHIEIMQELARKMNHVYKTQHFTIPEAKFIAKDFVLPGTDGRKMSKSYNNTIPLFCSEKKLRKLINSIPTNAKNVGEPKSSDESSVVELHKAFASENEHQQLLLDMLDGIGWGDVKQRTFENIAAVITPYKREMYEALRSEPGPLKEKIKFCEAGVKHDAQMNLMTLKQIMGVF